MASSDSHDSHHLRPSTKVLTEGYDPRLSVGSARPAVFRSSTYVFSSPEAAERAFDLSSGRARAAEGEAVDLIYSRFNHPTPKYSKIRWSRWKTAPPPRWPSIAAWPPS